MKVYRRPLTVLHPQTGEGLGAIITQLHCFNFMDEFHRRFRILFLLLDIYSRDRFLRRSSLLATQEFYNRLTHV